MAPANFQARLERIQKAQAQEAQVAASSFCAPRAAGIQPTKRVKRQRRRLPVMDHLMATLFGLVLGCLVAVALTGLSIENSPWGPGSDWYDWAYYATMAGLGMAPFLIIMALFVASSRPGFALFSLAYLSGIVIPLII